MQHFNLWTQSPNRGHYPMGWSTNIQLYDLFPTLLQYFARNDFDGKYEVIADSWHLGRAGDPNLLPFAQRYHAYRTATNGLFSAVNLAPLLDGATWDQMVALATHAGFEVYLEGYAGDTPNAVVGWDYPGIPKVIHTRLTGRTQSGASAESIVQAVNANIQANPAGQPLFAVVTVGDGLADEDCHAYVDQAVTLLSSANPLRKFFVLRPSDVARAWKRAHGL